MKDYIIELDGKPVKNDVRFNKHPKRKNNEIVASMYALYQSGKSLAQIGAIYRKTRQAVYDQFRSRDYPLRSKQLKGLQMLDGIKWTLTKGGYLRGSVNGNRMLMHRYVWEKETGTKVADGWDVHHRDGNKQNNAIDNLEYLTKSDHNKKYSPHLNQFTSPTGSRRKKGDRIKAERAKAWERVNAI